jgi:1-deoxy-D-xylulose-5-phosphate synthase
VFSLPDYRHTAYEYGKAEVIREGRDVLILAVGNMVEKAWETAELLAAEGIHPTVVHVRFVKPFDEELVRELAVHHRYVVTMEDNVYSGGFSQTIESFLMENRICHRCLRIGLPDRFIEHGSADEIYEKYGMDAASAAKKIKEMPEDGTVFSRHAKG